MLLLTMLLLLMLPRRFLHASPPMPAMLMLSRFRRHAAIFQRRQRR